MIIRPDGDVVGTLSIFWMGVAVLVSMLVSVVMVVRVLLAIFVIVLIFLLVSQCFDVLEGHFP